MDFRTTDGGVTGTGGSDGCINFNDPVNAGLLQCIQTFDLPSIYANYCDQISLADFFVVISEAILARTHHTFNPDTIFGAPGLARQLRSEFRYGRETQLTCEAAGLVPKAEDGCSGI